MNISIVGEKPIYFTGKAIVSNGCISTDPRFVEKNYPNLSFINHSLFYLRLLLFDTELFVLL